jgi:excisionase family DNA binding protein
MDTLNEKMFSLKEVAAVLGCSRDSVVRLIRRDKLRAVSFPVMGGRGRNV